VVAQKAFKQEVGVSMAWNQVLSSQLTADRSVMESVDSPYAPFVQHQANHWGLSGDAVRLPEHFRGNWDQARVCFLGPHVLLNPHEVAPTVRASDAEYIAHYRERSERRDPFGHYDSIMDGRPWLSTELVHWPSEKELALQVLKSPVGPEVVAQGLALTWALLAASPVQALVLTGNDALKWVLPHLGWQGKKLPGVTQLHGQTIGRFPLPGSPGRTISVIASFHWSKEMPLFVRKVAGQEGRKVSEAISATRRMIASAVEVA